MISPDMESNPKRFWSFIKSKRRDKCGTAPLKGEDGFTHSDAAQKAEILNDQFTSVFNKDEPMSNFPDKGPSPHSTMDKITVTVKGVH